MSKETSGPAFPTNSDNYGPKYSDPGMDLRDYIAVKAMQGDLSFESISPEANDAVIDTFANHYYRIADAMLKARNQ